MVPDEIKGTFAGPLTDFGMAFFAHDATPQMVTMWGTRQFRRIDPRYWVYLLLERLGHEPPSEIIAQGWAVFHPVPFTDVYDENIIEVGWTAVGQWYLRDRDGPYPGVTPDDPTAGDFTLEHDAQGQQIITPHPRDLEP